jgi:four helix bundle protein
MRDFRKLTIWNLSIDLVVIVYKITSSFPDSEKFGLQSQMRRASVSIPSNIAEGCSRAGQMDFKRFLEISLGSLFELESQLIISEKLNYIEIGYLEEVLQTVNGLQKQINNLISKIKIENNNKS